MVSRFMCKLSAVPACCCFFICLTIKRCLNKLSHVTVAHEIHAWLPNLLGCGVLKVLTRFRFRYRECCVSRKKYAGFNHRNRRFQIYTYSTKTSHVSLPYTLMFMIAPLTGISIRFSKAKGMSILVPKGPITIKYLQTGQQAVEALVL